MDEHVEIIGEDWTHTEALHHSGMPCLLWSVLRAFGCHQPPSHVGRMYHDVTGSSCTVHLCIPAKITYPYIDAWMVTSKVNNFPETWDMAALKRVTTFCENNRDVPATPFALLPVREPENNPAWRFRMSRVQDATSISFNPDVVVPCYYATEVFSLYERREHEVKALFMGLRYGIEHRNESIAEREQQISDKDARIAECEQQVNEKNAQIAALEQQNANQDEQIAELQEELGDAQEIIHDLELELEVLMR